MTKQEFIETVQKLVTLGEDKEELQFWLRIYDDLDDDKREELNTIVQDELEKLKSLQRAK